MKIKNEIKIAALLIAAGTAGFLYLQPQFRDLMAGEDSSQSQALQLLREKTDVSSNLPRKVEAKVSEDRYWEHYPNTSESFGVNFEETGPRTWLNRSQAILQKALKNAEDVEQLKALFTSPENYQAILDHYDQLPEELYFVEEATRIKMLDFLIASMELGGEWQERALPTARRIASLSVKEIGDLGLAQSVSGDVLRLLAALSKYNPTAYQDLTRDLKDREINSKLIAYFEQSKSGA